MINLKRVVKQATMGMFRCYRHRNNFSLILQANSTSRGPECAGVGEQEACAPTSYKLPHLSCRPCRDGMDFSVPS